MFESLTSWSEVHSNEEGRLLTTIYLLPQQENLNESRHRDIDSAIRRRSKFFFARA